MLSVLLTLHRSRWLPTQPIATGKCTSSTPLIPVQRGSNVRSSQFLVLIASLGHLSPSMAIWYLILPPNLDSDSCQKIYYSLWQERSDTRTQLILRAPHSCSRPRMEGFRGHRRQCWSRPSQRVPLDSAMLLTSQATMSVQT